MFHLSDPLASHGDCECSWCDPDPEDLANYRPTDTVEVQGEIL